MDWVSTVTDSLRGMAIEVVAFLPNLLSALVLLMIGWVLGKGLRVVVTRLLQAVRFDKLAERWGLMEILARGDVRYPLIELVGLVVFWIVFLVFLDSAAEILRLTIISNLLGRFVAYIPSLLGALIILGLGILLANLIGRFIRVAAGSAGLAEADLLGKTAQYLVIIVTLGTVLEQLQLATSFVLAAFLIIMASIGLAFGLAGVKRAERLLDRLFIEGLHVPVERLQDQRLGGS